MIYVLVGGPRDGQYVDDIPLGYRPDSSERPASPYDAIDGFEMVRAVWLPTDRARLRVVHD
ncbi:hypothetical protein [Microbacterium aquimaris]|uniref:Uncharacterized protein n=1 Tax=Microbacterium aquimaris TaxID=459816 RepID=A0ABU5N5I0_9MICO|nr:hypothetical protein [Microbacterium aquimaris]MDZ8161336.1 hypothetical protein [Microbacterium aquimaris]